MTKVCIFLVYFAGIYSCKQTLLPKEEGHLNDVSSNHSNPKELVNGNTKHPKIGVVRQRSGSDISLKCNIGSHSSLEVVWEFMRCELDYNIVPCGSLDEDDEIELAINNTWSKLTEPLLRKKDAVYLVMREISVNNSGIYRCSVADKAIKLYIVEIIESLKNILEPPELLTVVPSNITIRQNMQFILQCKVHSRQPPVIWWFKESDGSNYDIQYYDKYYSRINTTVQVYPIRSEINIYLSKLNIYHAQNIDSGIYVCVAITESGKDYKDAVVQVISTSEAWEPNISFFLLFLIPITFALIPVIAWLWYYRKKKKNESKIHTKNFQDGHLITPILCDTIVLSDNIAIGNCEQRSQVET